MIDLHIPVRTDPHDLDRRAERRAAGKALRRHVPRSSHATWSPPPARPDPVSLLEETTPGRLAHLVPIRYGRMITSPFAFLRGSAVIMANDLATTPVTGIQVQACGDAHLGNFGTFATPERNQVFDLNDFDETLPGPWEWDVKRLAASIVVAGRALGFAGTLNRQAVLNGLRAYREHMAEFAGMRSLDLWYSRIDVAGVLKRLARSEKLDADHRFIKGELERARRRTSLQVFPKLTSAVDGQYHIADDPPLLTHIEDNELAERLRTFVQAYGTSLQDDRHALLDHYQFVDMAQKVVGVGSVGTRCFIALLLGHDSTDPLFLQIKEAQASVLERHLGPSVYPNAAQRVVCGQRLIQAASDIFLGWSRVGPIDYYVRQLRDMKLSLDIERMSVNGFIVYAGLCGWALARAHARSGDPAQISAYLGKGNVFDRAVTSFAELYADQTERDHAALVEAARSGRIPVAPDV